MTFWHLLEDVGLGIGTVAAFGLPFVGPEISATIAAAAFNGGMFGGAIANQFDTSATNAYQKALDQYTSEQSSVANENTANQMYNSGLNAAASGQNLNYQSTDKVTGGIPSRSEFHHFWGGDVV